MNTKTVARLRDVSKHYLLGSVQVTALSALNLEVKAGAFTFVTGPSGSGKTTALNLLGAIDKPSQGSVDMLGQRFDELSDTQLTDFRCRHIAYIFQNFNLIPVLNVYENVEYPRHLMGLPKAARQERVTDVLDAVGLYDRAQHKPNELSGGQRQRVAIARALVKQPTVVLADEPTANLDSQTSRDVTALMQQMQRKFNTTFVFSSHDPDLIAMADEVYHLVDGQLTDIKRQEVPQ